MITTIKREGKWEDKETKKSGTFNYTTVVTPDSRLPEEHKTAKTDFPTLQEWIEFLGGKVDYQIEEKDGVKTSKGDCLVEYLRLGYNGEMNRRGKEESQNSKEARAENMLDKLLALGMSKEQIAALLASK